MHGVEQALLDVGRIERLGAEHDLPGLEARQVLAADSLQCEHGIGRHAAADDELQPAVAAEMARVDHAVGDRVAVDVVAAHAERSHEVDAAEHHALHPVRLGRQRGDGIAVVVAADGLQVEEELGVERFVGRVHLVLRQHVLGEGVAGLDHRCDDEVDADLLRFQEVADGLAPADLHGQLQVAATGDLHEPEQLVDAGALSFELGLDADVPVLVPAPAEDVDHLAFGLVHVGFLRASPIPPRRHLPGHDNRAG